MKKSKAKKAVKNNDLEEPPRPTSITSLILITAASILPYLPSLRGDFVFDDAETVLKNAIVRGDEPLYKIFTSDFWGRPISSPYSHKSYRPVTTFTFWLNFILHGESTLGYHIVNIALHAVASLLLYRTTQSLMQKPNSESASDSRGQVAFYAAIAFALHPVHSEAVANISGRAELLMTCFSLAALLVHIEGRQCSLVFMVLVVLSTFSKEQGVMILPICIVYDLIFSKTKKAKNAVINTLTFVLLIALRLYVNGFIAPKFTSLDNPAAFVKDPLLKALSIAKLWSYHAMLLMFPYPLCFDYSMGCISTVKSVYDPVNIGLPLIVLLIATACIVLPHKRITMFAFLLGILSFLPASNLFVTVGFTVAERVLYLPSVGFCILLAVAVDYAISRWPIYRLLLLFAAGLAINQCYKRSIDWSDELSLYTSGLQVCPTNAKIPYNIGKVLSDRGFLKEAESNYWNAIRLNPNYEQALNNLGNILDKAERHREAEQLFEVAVKRSPSFATAWMNLGISRMKSNKYQSALEAFDRSLRLRPNSADCLFNLGNLHQRIGNVHSAKSCWINATSLNPHHVQSWTNLLVLLDELDECDEAIPLAQRAVQTTPQHPAIHLQLGCCLAKRDRFEEAEEHIGTAVRLQPNNPLNHANLGILYQRWKRYAEALTAYKRALLLQPKLTNIADNMRTIQQKLNQTRVIH